MAGIALRGLRPSASSRVLHDLPAAVARGLSGGFGRRLHCGRTRTNGGARGVDDSPAASAVGFIAGCGHRVVEFIWVRAVIVESGLIAAKHRRAVDSTVIEDAVAHQGMVTMLVAQIRRVPKLVPELGSGVGPRTQPRGWPAPV